MESEIIIIGAGASGLIAARELTKSGKKVTVLEARNRIGGRIMPLNEVNFGYSAQGGAEWVHGDAPITKALIKEAGLTLIPEDGEIWSARSGELTEHTSFIKDNPELKDKLEALTKDISIADFLEQNFKEEKDIEFKNSIFKMVEGYDAADPKLVSTLTLRDEWLTKPVMSRIIGDHRIKEGYGALISFLESECKKNGVKIKLNTRVISIIKNDSSVNVTVADRSILKASKVIVTVPLPVLKDIGFNPKVEEQIVAASKIGFGSAIKLIIRFKTRWWEKSAGKDLTKMAFTLCNDPFLTWWTQYPEINTVLTGWMAGPIAAQNKDTSSEELLDMALITLSNIFKTDKKSLEKEIVLSEIVNWPRDPFAQGSYSYTRFDTDDAYEQLAEPYDNAIFFAGEALYSGKINATVEGALGSGLETARRIIEGN